MSLLTELSHGHETTIVGRSTLLASTSGETRSSAIMLQCLQQHTLVRGAAIAMHFENLAALATEEGGCTRVVQLKINALAYTFCSRRVHSPCQRVRPWIEA